MDRVTAVAVVQQIYSTSLDHPSIRPFITEQPPVNIFIIHAKESNLSCGDTSQDYLGPSSTRFSFVIQSFVAYGLLKDHSRWTIAWLGQVNREKAQTLYSMEKCLAFNQILFKMIGYSRSSWVASKHRDHSTVSFMDEAKSCFSINVLEENVGN